jgi:hypothetical protein
MSRTTKTRERGLNFSHSAFSSRDRTRELVVSAPSQAGSRHRTRRSDKHRDPHTALVAVCRRTRGTGEARSSSIVPPRSAPAHSTTVPEAVILSPMLARGVESDSKGTSNVATSTEPDARTSTVRSQLGTEDSRRGDHHPAGGSASPLTAFSKNGRDDATARTNPAFSPLATTLSIVRSSRSSAGWSGQR